MPKKSFKVQGHVTNAEILPGVEVNLYDRETATAVTLGAADKLQLYGLQFDSAAASGTIEAYSVDKVGDDITAKNTGTNKFTIAGDHVVEYQAYTHVTAKGSTGDNGRQAIVSVAANGDDTDIEVASLTDATADGALHGHHEDIDKIFTRTFSNTLGTKTTLFPQPVLLRAGFIPFVIGPTGAGSMGLQGEVIPG